MRSSHFELQKPQNDCAHEREHQTYLRWDLPPLCYRFDAWVQEGFRCQETGKRRAVAMFQLQLWMVHQPCLILVCWVERLLSNLFQLHTQPLWRLRLSPNQVLYAVCRLRVPEDQQLYILPKLWKEVHIDGCNWTDHLTLRPRNYVALSLCGAQEKRIISSLQQGGQCLNGYRSCGPQTGRRQILHVWEISVPYDAANIVDVPLLRCALYFLDNRTQLYTVCGGLTWVFSASPAHASPRQTNRHTLQETSHIAYLDDLIVVIRIGDVGISV